MKINDENLHLVISNKFDFWERDKINLLFSDFCLNDLNDKNKFNFLKTDWNEEFNSLNDKINKKIFKLEEYYENILVEYLNLYHSTSNDYKYWRTIFLPWLRIYLTHFITLAYKIEYLLNSKKITSVSILNIEYSKPNILIEDYLDFQSILSNVEWNERVLSEIILNYIKKNKNSTSIIFVKFDEIKTINFQKDITSQYSLLNSTKDKIRECFFSITKLLPVFNSGPLIVTSFLPFYNDLVLKILFFQNPIYWNFLNRPSFTKSNKLLRKLYVFPEGEDFIDNIISKTIQKNIPKSYLENYLIYKNYINQLRWPSNPKFIFTSNSHITDDSFKIWTAELRKKNDIKLFIGQHGSGYAIQKNPAVFNPIDIKVADYFLTWGSCYNDSDIDKIITSFNFRRRAKINFLRSNNKNKGFVFVTNSIDHRTPLSSFLYDFNSEIIQNHVKFLSNISENILKNSIIRLRHRNTDQYGHEKKIFQKEFPDLCIEEGFIPISRLLFNYKIVVFSYDSTGALECISDNKPFIMILSKYEFALLQENAKVIYEQMIDAKIFFTDVNKASSHINQIYNNIDSWWFNKQTKQAIAAFSFAFSKKSYLPSIGLWKIFKSKI